MVFFRFLLPAIGLPPPPTMANVFSILPGIEVPVGSIATSLARLWESEPGSEGLAPSEFRASQMNLVLHFGFGATEDSAHRMFDTVVTFARRYPCRAVILCPLRAGNGEPHLQAKIFSECYIGQSRREMSCCEFILLCYPPEARAYLENQVSICLEGDLPIYYWPHGITSSQRLVDYRYLLNSANRIVLDTALEPPDILDALQPYGEKLHDLVCARLLPVRQTLGQFLSGYAPGVLAAGLSKVTVAYGAPLAAESQQLLQWVSSGLRRSGVPDQGGPVYARKLLPKDSAASLELRFVYKESAKHFTWKADLARGTAVLDADFGAGRITLPAFTKLLEPVEALGEALFF